MDLADTAFVGAVCAIAALVEEEGEEENELRGNRARRLPTTEADVNGFRVLDDPSFHGYFRINRFQFEKLLVLLGNFMEFRRRLQRRRTGLDLRLMMTLWVLATQDTFRSVTVKFGVPSRSTVHYHYKHIIKSIRESAPLFIQWPHPFERDDIKAVFERKYGYPGVVGCIDGTHIYISAPLRQAQRYVNRFSKYSILLQAVCDHRKLFRDIYVGEPGSVNDSRMFQRSPLSHNLLHDPNMVGPDEHILGDGAYMLTDKVITPYRDNGRLDRRKRSHNYTHASARSCVERTFSLDKGLWRRQKLMLVYSLDYLIDTVVSSCVLHNFMLLDGEPYRNLEGNYEALEPQVHDVGAYHPYDLDLVVPDNPEHEESDDSEDADNIDDPREVGRNNDNAVEVPEIDPALRVARQAGRVKRDFIAYTLHPHD